MEDTGGRADEAAQTAFHARIAARNLAALWVGRRGVDLSQPRSPAAAAVWRYEAVRPDIFAAGDIITAEEAFRRVLVLENPAFRGEMRVTNTLYAGLQLVLPGEIAPCHRHSQTALRFVIEGSGAYTAVDGERAWLNPGDFVITPCWSWHDHGNAENSPVIWMDVLDTPLVGFLDTVFRETYPAERHQISRPDGDSPARYGAGLLPERHRAPAHAASPVFSYPYTKARAALESLRAAGGADACHGVKMEYINPASGGAATPTMGTWLQLLPAGFDGAVYRSTDSAVCCVVEGSGETVIGEEVIAWSPRDVFVVPGWRAHRHRATRDAVLFSVSDRPVHISLGLWREERESAPA